MRDVRAPRRCLKLAVVGAIAALLMPLAPHAGVALAVQPGSTLLAFGYNDNGQIGDGTTTARLEPVEIAGMNDIVAVDAGWEHSLALRADGRVYAWGFNNHGQLGDGTLTTRLVPTLVPGLSYVTAIEAGGNYSLAIRSDGSVWQWGAQQTLPPTASPPDLLVPVRAAMTSLTGASLGAGGGHRLVVATDSLEAWGDNTHGQLSDGTINATWTPVNFGNPWGGARQAEGGWGHTVLRLSDGTLRAIGLNDNGQLGDGSFVERQTLVQVPGISDVAQVEAGYWHTLALTGDGLVWSWGDGASGQLGGGSTADRPAPAMITSLSGVTRIGAGGRASLAVNADGVWMWGWRSPDLFGATPVLIPDTAGATDLAGGLVHNLVLLNGVDLQLPDQIPTGLSITSSSNPAFVGDQVTLTFEVTPAPDMGTVSRAPDPIGPFTPIATLDPTTGTATFDQSFAGPGTYPAWYRFDGTPGFLKSNIVSFEQAVIRQSTTTAASPATATLAPGEPLTVSATVSPVPTDDGFAGYARLRDGGTPGDPAGIVGNMLVDPATGAVTFSVSTLTEGLHHLYVDFLGTDRYAGSTSSALDVTVVDLPTTTPALYTFAANSTVIGGKPSTRFVWTGADAGSGIARYRLDLSTDGGPFTSVATTLTTPSFTRALLPGHAYQARVRAVDNNGNVGVWAYGASFDVTAYQDDSPSLSWTGAWTNGTSSTYWGGTDRYATAAGATGSLTFTGRAFAWVGSVGPTRGWARIYVDDVLVRSIDLHADVSANRKILFARSWANASSRTITIRISGTPGHGRGDIDAFLTGT